MVNEIPASHPLYRLGFASLMRSPTAHSRRASSWDRVGGNEDFISVGGGETATLLSVEGPGCVTHLYVASILPEVTEYRDAIIRCWWDGADLPAVEVPLGDFFALAHGRVRELDSAMVSVNPGLGGSYGLNAYFPMPFSDSALITIENRGLTPLGGLREGLWFHVDYQTYTSALPSDSLRFHAQYRQERPTEAVGGSTDVTHHDGKNTIGNSNYVCLDTRGKGQMVGLLLEIDNRTPNWYGEGDDMVFVDGERWPPAIHGTGTEEVCGGGGGPNREYQRLYAGIHMLESADYRGQMGAYRWFLPDPICFHESIKWTIEHGHANNFSNDYASVAYWYQAPQSKALIPLPERERMLPRLDGRYEEARDLLFRNARRAREKGMAEFVACCEASRPFYAGDWNRAIDQLRAIESQI